ncbi:hypothetical protein SAMN06272735_3007 [Streptomyces sp. TLI_55]|uniref:hypothetical protein n=1 Tax=Streptomyces sp. TLI_55 TaxID=1938861 RepID=UPI000BCF85CD|nr:hypothetical protein [Streptomyces sp. TLI_55]SNX58511.1 hypothetical protein SAMN06272735_3007 [Streptomyces sp. TLI_55]
MRRAVPVVVLACAVAGGVSGCRVGGDDTRAAAQVTKPAASVCTGAIRWGRVSEERTLVAVSRVVTVGKDSGEVRLSPLRVRELVPRVETSGPGPSAERVLASLDKRLGDAFEVARPGRSSATVERPDVADFLGSSGRFVSAWGVRAVEATFTADCGTATPVYGSVSTWYGNSGASLRCGRDPAEHGNKERWVTEAYTLACGDGS